MLLEYQEKDSMKEKAVPPFPFPLKQLPRFDAKNIHHGDSLKYSMLFFNCSPHKSILSRITALTNVARGGNSCRSADEGDANLGREGNIVTVSKDGLICFWKSNLTLNRTIQVSMLVLTIMINWFNSVTLILVRVQEA